MAFHVDIDDAKKMFKEYTFVNALTPSAQKAAFHVRDKDGNNLCLKIVSPNYEIGRVHREISAMQKIKHANVVQLIEYTYSTTPGSLKHFLVEEFIEGDDLDVHLTVAWERERVSKVFVQLMNGLEQLNSNHIVHRDLKPKNIRLRNNDQPVIIDFGLARHLKLSDITATIQGAQIGTPHYFAPEQFLGNKYDIDHRTDLFAAGIIIYQALIGRHPFYKANMSSSELQDNICNSNKHLKETGYKKLPRKWQLLLKKLLEKQRAQRVNTARIAAELLRKLETV